MTSGVYERKLPETYRGFKRLRQVPNGAFSSQALCEVPCAICGTPMERTAKAIRNYTEHRCKLCNVEVTLRKRGIGP